MRGIRQVFADIPIVRKLYIGFGAVLVALLVFSVEAIRNVSTIGESVRDFADIAHDARLVADIEGDLVDLQLQVREYLATREEADARHVDELYAKLAKGLANAKSHIQKPERVARIDEIIKLETKYGEGFERVRKLNAQRDRLVNDTLNPIGQRMRETVVRLGADILAAAPGGREAALAGVLKLQEDLLTARIYVNRFLVNNDLAEIKRARLEFAEVAASSGVLEKLLTNPVNRQLFDKFAADFVVYSRTFGDLVDTITERNQIRDEIFDAAGMTIKINAQAITESAAADMRATSAAIGEMIKNSFIEIALLAFLTVVAAAAAARVVGRDVAWPIRDMTGTMKRLAAGDTGIAIPGVSRKDEIGAIANTIGVFRDNLIQIELARAAERRAAEAAEKSSTAKSEFLSSMSHELRTPMNAILGFSQLLEMDKSLTPAQHRHVETILKAGDYLLKLIDDVLDLARIEAGKLILSVEDVSLAGFFLMARLCSSR